MQPVSGLTLMVAIQSVDAEIRRLEAECEAETGPELPDLQDLLLSYHNAADELRKAYIEECRHVINLPPYEMLIEGE